MTAMIDYAVYECVGLELRQRGRRLSGRFPYGATATVSDRGTVRKERFAKRAFSVLRLMTRTARSV